MDIKDLSNKIREIIKDFECNVYLFGSRVKGNYRKDSDLDIAVFNSTGLKFLKIEEALENSNIPYSMDIICMDMIDNKTFIQEVIKNGIRIWFKVL